MISCGNDNINAIVAKDVSTEIYLTTNTKRSIQRLRSRGGICVYKTHYSRGKPSCQIGFQYAPSTIMTTIETETYHM